MQDMPVRETDPGVLFPEHPARLCPPGPAAPMTRVLISMEPGCRYPMLALTSHPCVDGRCRCDEVFMRIEASRLSRISAVHEDWHDAEAFVVLDLERRHIRLASRSREDGDATAIAQQLTGMLTGQEWDWITADRQRARVLWAVQRSSQRPRRRRFRGAHHS